MNKFIFDLQRFSNLGTLKTLGGIIKTLGLVKLAKDLDNAKDASKWLKENANPILRFIGSTPFGKKFSSYATLITSTISIVDNALSVLTDKNLPVATRNSKIGAISGSLVTMANATNKLNKSLKKKNLWFLSILSSGISLTANLIAASDGVTLEEKKKINNGYVTLLKSLGSDLVKEIFDSAVEKQLSRAFTEDLTTDLVEEIMTKNKFFQTASKTLTKTFGVVLSLATGALNSIDEYNERMEKYNTDGIPEDIAKHDAFIDAFATFVHDNLSAYFKGVDDWVFEFMLGVAGGETNKNYIEVIADRFKTFNYKNTGSIDNDPILLSASDKSYIYGDSGNDSIKNVASDVSIWGGHDNDTIWSLKTDTITPARNSILGGPGDDFIYVQDKNSTIYGGAGNDSLITDETKNLLYGGSGDDYIFLVEDANSNTVSGDLGNDLILIDSAAKKNKFRYSTGDGNDTISGFNANDSLIIDGKYSTTKSGSDIKVKVGTGSILLLGAADKKIYINGNVYNDTPDSSGTFTPIEIPYLSVPKSPLINGTSGNDTIKNSRSNVLINADAGNDYILNGGYDNSNIWHEGGAQVTIDGGKGNDSIGNIGDYSSIDGGAGNDSICNSWGSNVTINGGVGNDSISNSGDYSSIDGGAGNNTILNYSSHVTIEASIGNDYIGNFYSYKVTINAGDGDNTIESDNSEVSIISGAGNDSIFSNEGSKITIDAGDGDNDIHNSSGSEISIISGAGNDSIFNSYVILYNSYGTKATTISPENVTIISGAGNDYIFYEDGSNIWTNKNGSSYLDGGDGRDTIRNDGWYVSINAGAGDDLINNTGWVVSINASDGDDFIDNQGRHVSISSGAGNDVIINECENVTINGGKSSDNISLNLYAEKNLIQYSSGDGNDTVFGFNEDDTLQIGGGTGSYFSKTSGNDVIVTVGTGKITLVGAASLSAINIDGVWKDPAFLTVTNSKKSPVTVDSVVKTIDASKRTSAIKITGNKFANSISGGTKNDSIFGGAGNDSILGNAGNDEIFGDAGNDSLNGGNGDDTLTGGAGNDILIGGKGNDIFIYSAGNDTISDYAAGDKISLNADVTKTTLNDSDVVFTIGKGSLTVKNAKGKTLNLVDSKGTEYSTLVSDFLIVTNSTKSPTTIESFVKTVDSSSRTKVIAITGNALANAINGGTKNDSLYGAASNDSILGNDGSDKLYGDAGNDILLGGKGNDSLWGGAGNDTLTGNDGNDIFIYEAGNDIITDYTAGQDKIQIASGTISKTSLSGSDVLFTIGKGALTVKNAKGKTINLLNSAGKASSTVVGAQTLTNSNKASVTIAADMGIVDASARTKAIAITGNALANTISSGTKNDSIFGAAGNDSILGNAGNDKLYGDTGNDILLGGKGNDSLWGGAGNDTLTGGDGNDIFIYESGNDFISDYTAGQDKIQIASGTISKTSLNGSNVLLTIGKNSLTLKNAKGKTISLLDSSNKASSTVVGAQVLTNSNKANVTIGVDMGFVDSSARTKAISITGNALANTISGGSKNDSLYGAAGNDSILGNAGNDKLFGDAGNDQLFGGNGNDSLWGRAGNDSLWGNAGKDTFIYTTNEGTDKIFDYETGDMLKILNADGTDASFKSSKYSGGDLTLSINGGGKIIFDDIASNTKFNINGSSYNISGSKLLKK